MSGSHPWTAASHHYPSAATPVPTAPARSWAPWFAGVAGFLVLALAAVVVTLALEPAPVLAGPAPVTAAPSPYGSYSAPSTTYPASSTPPTPSPVLDASQQLESLADSDRTAVEAVTDEWVPQLSAKKVGMTVGATTYTDDAVLADHQALRGTYPDVRLLRSDDWPVFRGSGFWITIVAQPYSTAAAANAWCSAQGIGPDDCFAKRLSHTGGPDGATVQR